ncbi:MAG: hypothetical protein HZA50_04580 [Planctomycetes bacterium]|nr:hypothetical protein [Planctomycetota bacterium]
MKIAVQTAPALAKKPLGSPLFAEISVGQPGEDNPADDERRRKKARAG